MAEVRPNRQDGAAGRSDLWLEARPERVVGVRRALERMGLPQALLDDAKLLTSELVTNRIRHAGLRPDDLVHVTAVRKGAVLRVIVWDGESAGAPHVAGAIRPRPGAESGWGLYLVNQMASRWGTNLGGRRCYWFEIEEHLAAS